MTRPRLANLLVVALVLGAVDAVTFVVFEAAVDHGTDEVWNTLAGTDETRWRVVPLAIALSIVLSFIVRLFQQSRYTEPHTDLLAEGPPPEPASVASIVVIFIVGWSSLVAGASLGPEASLVALSVAIGTWLGAQSWAREDPEVMMFASIGALLVAFVGSLVPILLPLLVFRRRGKWSLRHAMIAVVAGVVAYITLLAIQRGSSDGYGTIPAPPTATTHDYVAAAVLGVVAVFVARGFHWLVGFFRPLTNRIDAQLPWALAAALFGTGLGVIYLAGGETIQFSGQSGSVMLLQSAATYSTLALGGLALAKLLATAWSLTSGYRGGVVFPSIYTAVATGLFASGIASSLGGPGVEVGVVAGMLTALTGAAFAVIFLLSLLPAKLFFLSVVGVAGAVLTDRVLTRVANRSA